MKKVLSEGLIKIPTDLEQNVNRFVMYNVFWYIRDKFTSIVRKELPEHWLFFKQQLVKNNISLPKEKYTIPDDGLVLRIFPLNIENLPINYSHLVPDRNEIRFVLDWKGTIKGSNDSLAKHSSITKDGKKRSYIIIFLNKARDLNRIPSPSRKPDELMYVLDDIFSSVRHELQHFIQYSLLQHKDKKQIEQLPDYKSYKTDYYASKIEFDPHIADAIDEFIKIYNVIKVHKNIDLKKTIKTYTGLLPSRLGDGFGTSTFFKSLKKKNIEAYKKAIKKFYIGVTQKLTLNESMSIFAQWKRWWGNTKTGELLAVPGGMDHDEFFFENLENFFSNQDLDTFEFDDDGYPIDNDTILTKAYSDGWQAILYDGSTKDLMGRFEGSDTSGLRKFISQIADQVPVNRVHIDKNINGKIHSASLDGKSLDLFLKNGTVPKNKFILSESSGDNYFDFSRVMGDIHDARSRSTLVYMSPEDFLLMAQRGFSVEKQKRVEDLISKNIKFSDLPMLSFVHDGKGKAQVVGHEGRHRVLALKNLGISKIPVIIRSNESRSGKGIRWGLYKNQDGFDYVPIMPKKLHGEDGRGSIPMPKSEIFP